jgi:cell division protein FtsW
MATKALTPRRRIESNQPTFDWGLLSVIITLLAFGVVMVFSASFARGLYGFENPYYFFTRQLLWAGAGLVGMWVAIQVPYTWYERWSIPLIFVTLLLLVTVLIFGTETYGSTRTFFGGSVQPSEPAKIAIIIYIATWLSSKGQRIRDVRVGLLPFSVMMGIITVLIVSQPNISTSILIVSTATVMLFIAGADLRQLFVVGLGGSATFWLVIQYSNYARGRIERHLASIWDPLHSPEWQTFQSAEAFIRGGFLGVGVGNSTAKLPGYLPLAWSDNIFVVIGEELGLLGALVTLLLFALFAQRGIRTAIRAPDNFGMLLATGLTALLILQTVINVAVTVAVAPPTGIALPFITYGGSSLLTALVAAGILLNISRARPQAVTKPSETDNATNSRIDLGWRDRGPRLPRTSSSGAAEPTPGRSRSSRSGRNS